jgi:hypothetical protein
MGMMNPAPALARTSRTRSTNPEGAPLAAGLSLRGTRGRGAPRHRAYLHGRASQRSREWGGQVRPTRCREQGEEAPPPPRASKERRHPHHHARARRGGTPTTTRRPRRTGLTQTVRLPSPRASPEAVRLPSQRASPKAVLQLGHEPCTLSCGPRAPPEAVLRLGHAHRQASQAHGRIQLDGCQRLVRVLDPGGAVHPPSNRLDLLLHRRKGGGSTAGIPICGRHGARGQRQAVRWHSWRRPPPGEEEGPHGAATRGRWLPVGPPHEVPPQEGMCVDARAQAVAQIADLPCR